MTSDLGDIAWNSALERLIAEEGERCRGLAWLHDRSSKKYSRLDVCINLPVIVLSTLGGFFTASTGSILPEGSTTNGLLGGVSVLVGILNTVGSYFGWTKRAETHRMCSLDYSKIYKVVSIEMALPADQRTQAADFLKYIRQQIERLGEVAPDIPMDIIVSFNTHFKDIEGIKVPEITNGLEKINIFARELTIQTPKSPIRVTIE